MNKFIISFLFLFISQSQDIKWNATVSLNKYGWIPLDYAVETLIYYSNGMEYKCDSISAKCQSSKVSYLPNAYLVENSYHYYYNDDIRQETCSSFYLSSNCIKHSNINYIKEFESISSVSLRFYIKNEENIAVYNINFNGNLITPPTIREGFYRWIKDTLYSFKIEADETKVLQYSLGENTILWSKSLSYCNTKDPNNELFVSVVLPFVFIICSPANLIYKVNHPDGNIIAEYPLDSGNVKAFECSFEFLFILYGDANIVQYTLDFNYVHTYSIGNTRTPKYNTMKVDGDYIFCILCTASLPSEDCDSHVIYQWNIVKSIPKVIIN
jgi:hypothetical protein